MWFFLHFLFFFSFCLFISCFTFLFFFSLSSSSFLVLYSLYLTSSFCLPSSMMYLLLHHQNAFLFSPLHFFSFLLRQPHAASESDLVALSSILSFSPPLLLPYPKTTNGNHNDSDSDTVNHHQPHINMRKQIIYLKNLRMENVYIVYII